MGNDKSVVPVGVIQQRIFLIRGVKVMVDADLAAFYGVPTRRLHEQVRRNAERFPADFMFRLSKEEQAELAAKCEHLSALKYSRVPPRAFTEHGAIMAASVLNTPRAVEMSIFIVRAFVRLREVLSEHRELAKRVTALEAHLAHHDEHILAIFKAIKELMSPAELPEPRRIGFRTNGP